MTRKILAAAAALALSIAPAALANDCDHCPHHAGAAPGDAGKKDGAASVPDCPCRQGKDCKCGPKCQCARCSAKKGDDKKADEKKDAKKT